MIPSGSLGAGGCGTFWNAFNGNPITKDSTENKKTFHILHVLRYAKFGRKRQFDVKQSLCQGFSDSFFRILLK